MYNKLVEHVLLPVGDSVLNTEFMATLRTWRYFQGLSAGALQDIQRDKLRSLLEHASKSVPYYRDLEVTSSADPYEWLTRFPILTKRSIRDGGDSLLFTPKTNLVAASSSGSSGYQSTVYLTKREISRTQAIQTLWWEWAGYKLGNTLLQTGMGVERGSVKAAKDRILRTNYVRAFGLSEEDIVRQLEDLRRHPRQHLAGYASSLYLYAKVASDHGIHDITFNSVISWGDKMFSHYREKIETQFRTRVFDTYGCAERIMIAAQKDTDQYYVMSPHVVVELLDDRWQPVPQGELGRVVVTRLDGFAMPLIRYYLGDLAVAGQRRDGERYDFNFPLLDRIVGRDTDIVRTPWNQYMTVHTFTGILEYYPQIKQFRVVQKDLSGITIEYIPASGFTPAVLDEIRNKILSHLSQPFAISFVQVAKISPSPSGKPQIVESALT
jgi:phenylacetate-CoA ligase